MTMAPIESQCDVAIIGAGLAGLSLARQLLLETDKTVVLLDRAAEVPPERQKVGESCVQVSGYYFSKVLDLEEHLLNEHYMKYNLRFYWPRAGTDGAAFEDYQSAFIKKFSNIASYQLNRNVIEAELLRLNAASPAFRFQGGARGIEAEMGEDERPHVLTYQVDGRECRLEAQWVVDATGANRLFAKRKRLQQTNAIDHGSSFFWVEGLVDVERLTDLTPAQIRKRKDRAHTGHLPVWLATNHFMGEGFWLWVIPLRGMTSIGLVYDKAVVDPRKVSTPERLTAWICERFPIFARDLPQRAVVSRGSLPNYSYDCAQTISSERWALTGMAGRFSDPLYSPGGDLIAFYNTMIVDAVATAEPRARNKKIGFYGQMMRWLYEAYVPSYALSYDALGDQETFSMKYAWELTIYFGFYVFPFINDLFTAREFLAAFLGRFAKLGPLNRTLQRALSDFYQWKRDRAPAPDWPIHLCFLGFDPLDQAERTFYEVGVSTAEARRVLDGQLANLETFARYILAWIGARVVGEPAALHNRAFVEQLDIKAFVFDAQRIRADYQACADCRERYEWPLDPAVMNPFLEDPAGAEPARAETMSAGRAL